MAAVPDEVRIPVTLDVTVDLHQKNTNFDDVGEFHERFELPNVTHDGVAPHLLTQDLFEKRRDFMLEELQEFIDAHKAGDLAKAADGLFDLAWVAMGTAHFMGLPWDEGWTLVATSNMKKVRDPSINDSHLGITKPEGWESPDIAGLLAHYDTSLRAPVTAQEDPWDEVEVHKPTFRMLRDGEE